MRKKSHVLVARYIANHVPINDLQDHRKAFCLGSILPDLKPSFLTTKHEFTGTFDEVQERIKKLTIACNPSERNPRVYYRNLGEVIHYVADYFTFPHNITYKGTLSEHCRYENELKKDLKKYIRSGQASFHASVDLMFHTCEELLDYIKAKHKEYLSRERNVKEDIYFILGICYQVAQGMMYLFSKVLQLHNAKEELVIKG